MRTVKTLVVMVVLVVTVVVGTVQAGVITGARASGTVAAAAGAAAHSGSGGGSASHQITDADRLFLLIPYIGITVCWSYLLLPNLRKKGNGLMRFVIGGFWSIYTALTVYPLWTGRIGGPNTIGVALYSALAGLVTAAVIYCRRANSD